MTRHERDITVAPALLTEDGQVLDRRWTPPGLGWLAPGSAAYLDGGSIVWDRAHFIATFRDVLSTARMLESFVRLDGKSDEGILRYSQRWGFLDTCDHGLPMDHGAAEVPVALGTPGLWVQVPASGPACLSATLPGEPVEVWRFWIAQARALLVAMDSLREGKLVKRVDWEPLRRPGPWASKTWSDEVVASIAEAIAERTPNTAEGQRHAVGGAIGEWMRVGGVRLSLMRASRADLSAFVHDTPGLFGALGFQLALVTTGLDTWAVCSYCSMPYEPKRRPPSEERNCCRAARCRKAQARSLTAKSRAGKKAK